MMQSSVMLKNSNLMQNGILINGKWLSSGREVFEVINPFDGSIITQVAKANQDDLSDAVSTSSNAFKLWKQFTAKERGRILYNWYKLILANADDLAVILTLEQGKPLLEAKNEILYGASYLEWYSEEAKRIEGSVIQGNSPGQKLLVNPEPIGVCAAITPWNFPSAMLARKVAPALAAGCSMIAKPASQTPLSANALAYLALEAGVPPGVFNIIHGNSNEIGEFLCHNEIVRKLSFTGSTEVGISLYQNSAATMKKLSLELGGNAPLIVFEDADLEVAINGIMQSKFRNSGQTCICSNRVFVHSSIKDIVINKLMVKIAELRLGNGLDQLTTMGPLIDKKALTHAIDLIADASNSGANLICGGKVDDELKGLFLQPTLIDSPITQLKIFNEEIFAPILVLYSFDSEEEVISMANSTSYGLASYIFSRDASRIFRVSNQLECGMVGVNTGLLSSANVPFGGIKMSGFGKEGGKLGINEYLNYKYICLQL